MSLEGVVATKRGAEAKIQRQRPGAVTVVLAAAWVSRRAGAGGTRVASRGGLAGGGAVMSGPQDAAVNPCTEGM